MRILVLIASVALCLSAYLGFRLISVESRMQDLTERLGAPVVKAEKNASPSKPARGYEPRLAVLEHDVKALREDLTTLEAATGNVAEVRDPADGKRQILSIVEQEQKRVLDRGLQFNRKRWLEMREASLDKFAEQQNLTPQQVDQLRVLLSRELDGIVEVMRRKESLENPEQASSDWMVLLEETDKTATRLLNPAQTQAWNTARTIERMVLWPWLPIKNN